MPFFKKVSKEDKFNAKLAKAVWVDNDQLSQYHYWRENGLGPTRICTGPGPTGIYTGMGPTVSYTGPGPTTF